MPSTLHRRSLLRGMLAGSVVSIALPPLEIFMNSSGTAYASGLFPKRFGLFAWGNGMQIDRWTPPDSGAAWSVSEQLEPLSSLLPRMTVVTGTEVKIANLLAHSSGISGLMTGREINVLNSEQFTVNAPSIDQVIAEQLGGSTPFRSLEIGVQPDCIGHSFSNSGSRNYPETDAATLFERIFGAGFTAPGESAIIDPTLALRRSVLDSVKSDIEQLNRQLGTNDRIRMEQHLDSIRDLELRIALSQEGPPEYAACARPQSPMPVPDIEGRPQMNERLEVMSDLIAMAYACDLTRVISCWYSDPLSNVLFPNASSGHHQLTHDEPGDQPVCNDIVKYIMTGLGAFVHKLDSIEEGDGTLLDNMVLMATSDVSDGRTHRIDEYPMLLFGNAGNRIQNGIHYRSPTKDNINRVTLACMQALDCVIDRFGHEDTETTSPLTEILT